MATTTSPTHALAGPALDNRRIAAALIDLAAPLLAAIALVVAGLLTPAVALVLAGWTLYYFFALESAGGQTVGKRAMNLKVVSADSGGDPTMRQYAMRTLARVIDTPGIGLLVMLGTGDKRQRLGDIAGRTSVVDAQASEAAGVDAFDAAHLHARIPPPEPVASPEPEAKPKRSRPGLGGPELKMPSLRRKKNQIVMPEPEQVAPAPMPEPPAVQEPPVSEVKPFDPFAADAPEPSVEVVAHDEPEPETPEPPAPEIMERDVPDVEIVRDDMTSEPPAPEPMRPTIPAVPPPPADEPLPTAAEHEPARESEPELDPEPEHVEGIRDDGSSRVHVKPIETVSAMELLMSEAEEHP